MADKTKKQQKLMDKVDKVKQQVGTYGTAAIAILGVAGLGAAKKAHTLKKQRFKKYFNSPSNKDLIQPRKSVQKIGPQ